jgi:translation initiation factor 2 beta subunit (eIF-2beta)/eIF-5
MIKKYTRKQINQQAPLHDVEFVKFKDCTEMLEKFMQSAANAGADLEQMMSNIEVKH